MRTSMAGYGFAGEDVPGSDGGAMIVLDRRLERDFVALPCPYAFEPSLAR